MGRLIYLLDTNTISEPIKENSNKNVVQNIYSFDESIAISSVTVYEIMRGVHFMSESKRRLKLLNYNESVLAKFEIVSYTKEAAYWHSQEEARLKAIGKTPSFIDAQIAAVAKVNNLILVTRNTDDFKYFADLKLENWFN